MRVKRQTATQLVREDAKVLFTTMKIVAYPLKFIVNGLCTDRRPLTPRAAHNHPCRNSSSAVNPGFVYLYTFAIPSAVPERVPYVILYLLITITMCRRSIYLLPPNPDPSQQNICRPLALTEVTNLILDAFYIVLLILPVTFL